MSRLMTLMLKGSTTPERLRILASQHLDHLAAHGPTQTLRSAASEIAAAARTAADRAESDPTGWGRPDRSTPLARLQASVLYAILPAEEAWWEGRQESPNPDYIQHRQRQVEYYLNRVHAALTAPDTASA